MRNYDRINAPPPPGIAAKRAHIIGGGIAGLAAAAFLATDAHLPADRITVYESLPRVGGSMDADASRPARYTSRGERELEAWMECLWYLCSKVPSLDTPGQTVLDETHRANVDDRIQARLRLMERRGHRRSVEGPLLSPHDVKRFVRLLATPEEDLQGLTIADYVDPGFFDSTYWLCASSMLAFREYHSLIEARRYAIRFLMDTPVMPRLGAILHTKYNEYDSIIAPLRTWLAGLGVTIRTGTSVRDIGVAIDADTVTATRLSYDDAAGRHDLPLTGDDLVFFTNGSMTQNTTMADEGTVATLNRSTSDLGLFGIWQRLAQQDPRFGNPDGFIRDIDKTNWVSFFTTFHGDRRFFDFMTAKSGEPPGTGGAITIVDSAWKLSVVLYGKYFPDQPDDVQVMWAYGQCSDVPGDHIRTPMLECTGAQMLAELLHHCGVPSDEADDITARAAVSTAAMPFITSQFMPRALGDRPQVVPPGSVNLAFIGQFVEVPGDAVFTVETSVRSAMIAVWELTGLSKPLIPMHQPQFDVRALVATCRAVLGIDTFDLESLPRIMRASPSLQELLRMLDRVPAPDV
jgi:oleate hydratase